VNFAGQLVASPAPSSLRSTILRPPGRVSLPRYNNAYSASNGFCYDWQLLKRSRCSLFLSAPKGVQLGALVSKSTHGVASVASLILLADIGDQHLRALHFDFERGDQCIFSVNDDVSGIALNFKADRKLHLCLPLSVFKNIAQLGGVK
jgi:hypothetical protein